MRSWKRHEGASCLILAPIGPMHTTETATTSGVLMTSCPTLRLLYCGDAGVTDVPARVLHPGEMPLGREVSAAQGIDLSADRRSSRVHALVRTGIDGQQAVLVDAGSKNGSFVNGKQVKECPLEDGDIVRVGGSLLLLRVEPAAQVDANVLGLRGSAPAIRAARAALVQAATATASVLLLGESGTGKEVAAQALHKMCGRSGPLVAVNCAAIPEALAESQLFGHLPGAFTGARTAQDGYFRSAHGGTLFLDEMGELPKELQAKLLRVLEERSVYPVGSTRGVPVDVWVLAATNRDLLDAISQDGFRGDLYARLAQTIIEMPPLRKRREDILPLFLHLLGVPGIRITVALAEALLLHPFPFNVRELGQLAAQLRSISGGTTELDLPALAERLAANARATARTAPSETRKRQAPIAPPEAGISSEHEPIARMPAVSKEELVRVMQQHKGHISRVAEAIGRSRRQVDRLLDQHGLRRKDFLD